METTVASIVALAIAGVAALADFRTAKIANWITLPPLASAPVFYAFFLGPNHGLSSIVSFLLCALVPYGMFRQGAMGGGDVKLFAALGAVTGFDIKAGVEIQLLAFVIALVVAFGALAWRGTLTTTLCNVARISLPRLRASRSAKETQAPRLTPIRMGGPIFVGTAIVVVPYLSFQWGVS